MTLSKNKFSFLSLALAGMLLFSGSAAAIICDSTSDDCFTFGGPGVGDPPPILGTCCLSLGAPAATGVGPEAFATHTQSELYCGNGYSAVNDQCVGLICVNCCGGARALGGCDQ